MNNDKRNHYPVRDRKKVVLVDEELARDRFEDASGPSSAGDEYMDLERLFNATGS